jgi:DNA primase
LDIEGLKEYILENNCIPTILEELGCHHIKYIKAASGDNYYKAANPDGDNLSAVLVYENSSLYTINNTRDIGSKEGISDIISLVEFYKNENFYNSMKWVCDILEIDYYHDFDEDVPESIRLTKLIMEMQQGDSSKDEEKPLNPIPEAILSYYKNYVNDFFYRDNITYEVQQEFEIGYDEATNRITIPIRDELSNLVGVKGRLFEIDIGENENKYSYIEPCGRSKILYGLYKTYQFIKQEKLVYVGESEKSVLQMISMGHYNAVGIGGKKISKCQIDKLTRLCVDIVFLFDKDVTQEELQSIADRFIDGVVIYAVIDTIGILDEKESPTDNSEKFQQLIDKCKFRIK